MADTIKRPDEIWLATEWHKELQQAVVRRRYVARWQMPGSTDPVLVVFEQGKDSWEGVTGFKPTSQDYLNRRVRGVPGALRVYRREE